MAKFLIGVVTGIILVVLFLFIGVFAAGAHAGKAASRSPMARR